MTVTYILYLIVHIYTHTVIHTYTSKGSKLWYPYCVHTYTHRVIHSE